jgi:hypothetical protein
LQESTHNSQSMVKLKCYSGGATCYAATKSTNASKQTHKPGRLISKQVSFVQEKERKLDTRNLN